MKVICPECSGVGLAWAMEHFLYGDETCPVCKGDGQIEVNNKEQNEPDRHKDTNQIS